MPKQENKKEEMREVEVLEFSLTENEIDELLEKLNLLKETKTQTSFEVDENNEFIIHYEGIPEEEVVFESNQDLKKEESLNKKTSKPSLNPDENVFSDFDEKKILGENIQVNKENNNQDGKRKSK